ncbi:MAG: dihydrofolate reductase family protein, partial [Terrimicrobiaceae bacterium]|nr:dihydrofolate reductase family protein [Terrimicrobiaceae bacterium]
LHILPGGPSLPVALAILRDDYGVRRLVCEGGPRLFRALIEADMVDEIFLTLVPRVFGGARAPTLTGLPGGWLPEPRRFRLVQSQNLAAGELHCRFLRFRNPAPKIKVQAGPGKR